MLPSIDSLGACKQSLLIIKMEIINVLLIIYINITTIVMNSLGMSIELSVPTTQLALLLKY